MPTIQKLMIIPFVDLEKTYPYSNLKSVVANFATHLLKEIGKEDRTAKNEQMNEKKFYS